MLWGLAFLSQMIRTTTFETNLVVIVVLWLINAFTLVIEVSPRLTELLPLATRMVSRVPARAILPSRLSDMHFRQRRSTRRALM